LGTGAPLTLTDIVSTNNRDAGIAITGGVTATITNSRVTNNGFGGSVVLGAGLQITGGSNVTVNNSVVSGNTNSGDGGGAWINGGSLTINNSTFSGNSSGATGGGIFLFQQAASAPVVNVNESTISGNNATRAGAGIEINTNGTVNLRNATISGNTVAPTGVSGGGIQVTTGGRLNSTNATIVNNTAPAGGGVAVINTGAASFFNTIVANNTVGDCAGTVTSTGNNLSSDASCAGFNQPSDQNSTNPNLGPLANNGGATLTHLPLPGSPAIDRGSNTGCPATDQRAATRPQDGDGNGTAVCDIGAVEVQGAVVAPSPTPPGTVVPATPVPTTVPVVVVLPVVPQVFQNPGVLGVVQAPRKTPTPVVVAGLAPSAQSPAPSAGFPVVIAPPNTGDAGLLNQ